MQQRCGSNAVQIGATTDLSQKSRQKQKKTASVHNVRFEDPTISPLHPNNN